MSSDRADGQPGLACKISEHGLAADLASNTHDEHIDGRGKDSGLLRPKVLRYENFAVWSAGCSHLSENLERVIVRPVIEDATDVIHQRALSLSQQAFSMCIMQFLRLTFDFLLLEEAATYLLHGTQHSPVLLDLV